MSTISNERLEKLSEYDCADRYEVMSMATELLALRKEREAAVPVAESDYVRREVHVGGNTWVQCSVQAYERAKAEGKITRELYERPAVPVAVPDEMTMQKALSAINQLSWQECARDAYMLGWNACRAAMLAAPGKPVAETDTTSAQVESLAGKAVVPEGWKLVPIEPTPDMREAFHQANEEWEEGGATWSPDHQWKAMLAAAPEPCK